MDFLDPKKMRRHAILLYSGYFVIGIAILISARFLVYQANGYSVNSQGQVVLKGLLFVSSQPSQAKIYVDGKRNPAQTNNRLSLAAGQYSLRLSRSGYRDWARNISVLGGDVQNYDYPFLFPKVLASTPEATYQTTPGIANQSRDRRWLMVQQNATAASFDVYDLKQATPTPQSLTLPASLVTNAAGSSWQTVQWANDAQHVLLKHTYSGGSEYIVVDRQDVSQSVNLDNALKVKPADVTLIDNKYDQYYLLDSAGTLTRASKDDPTPVVVAKNVLSYKSFGSRQVVYATAQEAPAGKVLIKILDGDATYTVRQVAANTSYLLDTADYGGTHYLVVAAASENVTYIYKDPIGQLSDPSLTQPTALWALRVPNPSYVSFSPSTRYIMSQNGNQFAVYDIYLKRAHVYTLKNPLDAPQLHATWMDGDHLTFVSDGKQFVMDFDGYNRQSLMTTNAAQGGFFSQDYRYIYALTPNAAGVTQLQRTALRTAADL